MIEFFIAAGLTIMVVAGIWYLIQRQDKEIERLGDKT